MRRPSGWCGRDTRCVRDERRYREDGAAVGTPPPLARTGSVNLEVATAGTSEFYGQIIVLLVLGQVANSLISPIYMVAWVASRRVVGDKKKARPTRGEIAGEI